MASQVKFRLGLDRSLPRGGADEMYAKYFSEVTLDVCEEQIFKLRTMEEAGPRHVHLRRNQLGEVTIPPHVEENESGNMTQQLWTGHPKVDKTLFSKDRALESNLRGLRDMVHQRHVPALRASLERKNFGTKPGPRPFSSSFRAGIMNRNRKSPLPLLGIDMLTEH
eukprot:TRINITY_DN50764_c0_g1_i1.p1 TRINITY_DN50764_c0_g1~~TRINITY_DN50764_c0_g1_i1.p1  ORF type:complete len:188 (-),score=33.07 TRINITY_DN50764_c0_g1_i1:247-744(-)